ncbi:MAG: MotA/TolQ/ExbB proton channel family protein [Planctomycetota bacterium]
METLVQILYWVTTLLLVPVVVCLFGILVWSVLELGGFLREIRERRRHAPRWSSLETGLQSGEGEAASFFDGGAYPGFLAVFASRGRGFYQHEIHLAKLISDLEIAAGGRLARMSLGIRIGPMLGLMGTLIPMGPALMGLSAANLAARTETLVGAFATPVLGLLVGGICYMIALVRRRWYASDLSRVEYVHRLLHDREAA